MYKRQEQRHQKAGKSLADGFKHGGGDDAERRGQEAQADDPESPFAQRKHVRIGIEDFQNRKRNELDVYKRQV